MRLFLFLLIMSLPSSIGKEGAYINTNHTYSSFPSTPHHIYRCIQDEKDNLFKRGRLLYSLEYKGKKMEEWGTWCTNA